MPRLIIQNKKPVAHATSAKSSNVSSSLSGNMPLIQSQINLKTNDYINIKNAVKILENYSNHEGWIKLSTEIENNFAVDDIVYVTYTEPVETVGSFDLSNKYPIDPENTLNTFYTGYKVLYVNKYRNEVVINRHFNDITPGKLLKNQYLSKMSCRGGDYYNDVSDGVVYINCNVGTFGFLEGHVYSGSTTGTTISGATISISNLGLTTTSDINGYYSFILPTGTYSVNCIKFGYTSSNLLTYIYVTSTSYLDFHLFKPIPTTTTTLAPTTTTTTGPTTTTTTGPTTTTTTGLPGTTTTTTTEPGYHICAANQPKLSSSGTSIGLLSAGNLVLGTGTIGDYLIDWNLGGTGGTTVFTSGNASNTDIRKQSNHPFTNEPVQGGNLYVVIRYIYVDGIKYSPYISEGNEYSRDLANCLGSIIVTPMNCSNGVSGDYSHSVSYNNIEQLPENAARTFRFEIGPTTTSYAWEFDGMYIADEIKISYVTGIIETPLIDWVIGLDATTDYLSTPKKYYGVSLSGIITIDQPYVSGNYLKIEIMPSYYDPSNTNTNWYFYCKCFTTTPFNCELAPNNINQIGDTDLMQMSWDSINCKYILTYQTVGGAGYTNIQNCDLVKYLSNIGMSGDVDWSQIQTIDIPRNEVGHVGYGRSIGSEIETNDTFTITKTGTNLIYQFNSATDYNMFKNGYTLTTTSDINWLNYSSDPTNINHYKFIADYQAIALPPFGDTIEHDIIWISYDSINSAIFNDSTKTITFNLTLITNGYIDASCSTVFSTIDSNVNSSNNFRNGVDFIKTTKKALTSPFAEWYIWATTSDLTTIESQKYLSISNDTYIQTTTGLCTFTPDWYLVDNYWYFYKQYLKVEITNNSDPINNYKVSTKLKPDGSVDTVWSPVKEVSAGIEIYP